jgi:hypothetical protein
MAVGPGERGQHPRPQRGGGPVASGAAAGKVAATGRSSQAGLGEVRETASEKAMIALMARPAEFLDL